MAVRPSRVGGRRRAREVLVRGQVGRLDGHLAARVTAPHAGLPPGEEAVSGVGQLEVVGVDAPVRPGVPQSRRCGLAHGAAVAQEPPRLGRHEGGHHEACRDGRGGKLGPPQSTGGQGSVDPQLTGGHVPVDVAVVGRAGGVPAPHPQVGGVDLTRHVHVAGHVQVANFQEPADDEIVGDLERLGVDALQRRAVAVPHQLAVEVDVEVRGQARRIGVGVV